MSKLYSIYDAGADVYVFFGEFDHDRTAIEFFHQRCFYLPRTGEDMFLCEIGTYNSLTGEVDALERPKRVARGFSAGKGVEQELFPPPLTEEQGSASNEKSQVSKHINLAKRWFYAVLITLLLAAGAIYFCACNSPFITIERIENGHIL